ncbi:MAG TPA: cation diffusion facilitator family transporter [Sphingomonas sp.]|nr:cation diffusion facilitator family transporter [Sphingomonas sp.]
MSGGHQGHAHGGHAHDHTAGANTKMLSIALALTTIYLAAEVAGAFIFNSLALLSDAGHMLTDVAALAIALIAIKVGQKAPDDKRTYGYKRFEILAAAFNALMLFAIAIYVLVEGIQRLRNPEGVQSTGMLVVAVIGLIVNFVSMRLLMAGKDQSLNVKGAYLEVWADMLGSVGVIVGALAIRFTGATWIDPVVAIGIGLWVLPRTWVLLRDTANVLLEGVPRDLDLGQIRDRIAAVEGVGDVHDLHVWSMSTSDVSCTAHVVLAADADAERVRKAVTAAIEDEFEIAHSTIQTEREACGDAENIHP